MPRRFVVAGLAAFEPLDRAHRLLAGVRDMLEFGLQRVDFGVDRLGLARKRLDLLAAHLDELGMTLLFGIVQVLFAGSLRLDGLDLPTDSSGGRSAMS